MQIQHNYLLVTELPNTISVQQMAFSFTSGQCTSGSVTFQDQTDETTPWTDLQTALQHVFQQSSSVVLLLELNTVAICHMMADFTSLTLIAITQTVLLVLKLLAIPF